MNYCEIKTNDIANGPGVRVSLFVSGCERHCKGCFRPETWDFNYGDSFTDRTIFSILNFLKREEIQGLTVLGGEPLHPKNIRMVDRLVWAVFWRFLKKDIWVYTGYTIEELVERNDTDNILNCVDVIVDGEFIEEKKNLLLDFRGSENQRLVDVKKTMKEGKVVLWENPQKGRV